MRHRTRAAAAALAALALVLRVMAPAEQSSLPIPPPDRLLAGLPACRYDDVLTRFRTYPRHDVTLLDTIYRVTAAYAPRDLVPVSEAGVAGDGSIRRVALADLTALVAAARSDGAPVRVVSAYRSYAQQKRTFNHWVEVAGYQRALLASARAGHSEHQLGTAIDFASAGGPDPWTLADWGVTKAGAWMARNAWRYGFVLSYPRGKSPSITCYKYEPWHYRWFGRTRASEIERARTTSREYLWQFQ